MHTRSIDGVAWRGIALAHRQAGRDGQSLMVMGLIGHTIHTCYLLAQYVRIFSKAEHVYSYGR